MPKLAANLPMLFPEPDFLLRRLDAIGYLGWAGCEYNPRGDTLEGLKWATPYLVPR